MLLLALDTSTPAVTVALHDGERARAEATTVDPRRHTELLTPQLTQLLRDAGTDRRDVTNVVVGVGPGPFTGLRVGVVTALTMATALDVPVYGVCSLDVIAAEAASEISAGEHFLVATDARRREVYWAGYDGAGRRTVGPDVGAPADVVASGVGVLPTAGAGGRMYPDVLGPPLPPEYPSAAVLAHAVVAEAVELVPPEPMYLRRPDAKPASSPKSVLT